MCKFELEISNIRDKKDIHIEIINNHPKYPIHTHNFFECFLVTKGYCIHNNNGYYDFLTVGSFVIVPDNSKHAFINTHDLDLININLSSNHWKNVTPLLFKSLRRIYILSKYNNMHLTLSGQTFTKVVELLLWTESEIRTNKYQDTQDKKDSNILISTILSQVLLTILRSQNFLENNDVSEERNLYTKQTITHDIIDLIFSYHKQNQPIILKDFIKNKYRTYNTFLRKFKEITGLAPKDCEMKIKLYTSRQLISTNKHQTITSIVKTLGFYDMPYFSKLFKKEFKETPKTFRNRI